MMMMMMILLHGRRRWHDLVLDARIQRQQRARCHLVAHHGRVDLMRIDARAGLLTQQVIAVESRRRLGGDRSRARALQRVD